MTLINDKSGLFKLKMEDALHRFASGIRYKTVSKAADESHNLDEFFAFHEHIASSYPLLEATLVKNKIGISSLLYEWCGKDVSKPAAMLMAHIDVYPVEDVDLPKWCCDPFEGKIDHTHLWGRGSWDDKASLFSILEAVESLIENQWQPERTIYLAFGSDEAVGGTRDVIKIANYLRQKGANIEFMMVEGLVITDGILPGVKQPVALVGIAEKGYLSIKLEKITDPAFASSPPPVGETAAGSLSLRVNNLLMKNFEPHLNTVVKSMFTAIAPYSKGIFKLILSNLWAFQNLLVSQLKKSPTSVATIKTTVSMTAFHCENNDNMLPNIATCILNIRMLPGETIKGTVNKISELINDDSIGIEVLPGSHAPSPIESTATSTYKLVSESIKKSFDGVLVAPGLMVGATAARHFYDICSHIYRFTPIKAKQEDLPRFHGNNERISIDDFQQAINFYRNLLLNSDFHEKL
jgi:carboxypeptidase PM20D1